ncbi:hypothetical protein BH11MYX3_BH11MYX3_48530 [soil metagenome]
MNLRTWVFVLALGAGCKKHDDAAPSPTPSPAPGSNAPTATPPGTGSGSAAPIGVLAFDSEAADDLSALGLAFENKIPRLPALSADGKLLASYEALGGGPMVPQPMSLVISTFPDDVKVETFPLMTEEEGTKANEAGSNWTTPDLGKQLHVRAAAVLARLRGFRSLEPVTLAGNARGESASAKIGALTLYTQTTDQQQVVIELRQDKAGLLHREQIEPYERGTMPGPDGPTPCHYSPTLGIVYKDPTRSQIYLQIGFRYHEECDPGDTSYVSWSLDPADASPEDVIRSIV